MVDIESIRPTSNRRLWDLVREAGVDVSGWSDYSKGPRYAAANPKYCYEWSFVMPGKLVVLNVWHSSIKVRGNSISLTDNLRRSAALHAADRGVSARLWEQRARRFDEAVAVAASAGLPVRAVICDGVRRRLTERKKSRVQKRMLDPVPWSITSYDDRTGDFTMTRGAHATRLIDQFDIPGEVDSPTERRTASSEVFVRSPRVRAAVLARAAGRCEWCGAPGFVMSDGSVFLETHHIVPLGQDGPDCTTNVIALCPNHHREAHFGAAQETLRDGMLLVAAGTKRRRAV